MPRKTQEPSHPAEGIVPEHRLTLVHPNHSRHLCELVSKRQMARVADLSRGARFLCHICGRAAADGENLCEPVKI